MLLKPVRPPWQATPVQLLLQPSAMSQLCALSENEQTPWDKNVPPQQACATPTRFGPYLVVTPINPLLTPAWQACVVLRDRSSIFNIPSKHFELVRRHHFAVLLNIDKLLSGCGLQPIEDRRVDMPVSRPVSLARGGRNDLK